MSKRKMKKNITATTNTNSSSFGDDIFYEILSRVPTKSLRLFKLVCKSWRHIIEDRLKPPPDNGAILLIHPLGIPKKHAGKIPILFTVEDLFDGGQVTPLNVDLGRPIHRIRMLKPVNGLICFVEGASVLIFNPYTREKSSWIETTISASVGKKHKDYKKKGVAKYYSYSFGFGFDETIRKHKVVCICETRNYGKSKRRVCEVLTVGKNTWRKIDEVPPPYNLHPQGESVYADGAVYWRDENEPRPEVIVAFDLGTEKFKVVKVSNKMHDNWSTRTPQYVHLVDVFGSLTLLDRVDYYSIKYWISFDDVEVDSDRDWCKYTINFLPCPWNGEGYLAFQAIEGTWLIILQSFDKPTGYLESLYYVNQITNKLKKVEITGMSSFPTPKFGYEIRTLVECLLPVQNKQQSLCRR